METATTIHGIALALSLCLAATLKAQNLYVANAAGGSIGEYELNGSTVNARLISELSDPWGIAISGNDVFVANGYTGTIGEYTTSGVTVNAIALLRSLLMRPRDLSRAMLFQDLCRGMSVLSSIGASSL